MKQRLTDYLILLCTLLLSLAPTTLLCLRTNDISYLLTSVVFALPIAALVLIFNQKTIRTILLTLVCIGSLVETVMVVQFSSFILAGNILAVLTTNRQEAGGFAANALHVLLYFIPILVLYITSVWLISRKSKNRHVVSSRMSIVCVLSIAIATLFVSYKMLHFYKNKITLRYYIENRILTRPPYNLPYQIRNVVIIKQRKRAILHAEDMSFESVKNDSIPNREIYVLGIGESMRYKNFSLNGEYSRQTTPFLEQTANLVLYNNYYSTACLTMWSVPQIITRATPLDYDLNYKEKSIYLPFKETGFRTYCIESANLLGYELYLTQGIDSLIHVTHDSLIVPIIDSLSNIYPKTFFIFQVIGNHHPYYNYTENFNVYRPNINSDAGVKSDSLYINAYDNTYLYMDYFLHQIIQTINKPNSVSAMLYISDHGENVTATGGGHGGDCSPLQTEYHVPLLIWYSDSWAMSFPIKENNLQLHKQDPVNADNIFYSVCDMANISIGADYARPEWSIFADTLQFHQRYVLLPDGVNYLLVE